MSHKLRVGVIMGGRSGEHEVSIISGESVIESLDKNKYEVIPIGITKSGKWIADNVLNELKSGNNKELVEKILTPDPTNHELVALDDQNMANLGLDVVFPVLHGTYGEDGAIQGLFELANIPYVGSGVLGSSVAMDKVTMKKVVIWHGIEQVAFKSLLKNEWLNDKESNIKQIEKELTYPVFVKPANLGSSVGINKVKSKDELAKAIDIAFEFDRKIIIEQGLEDIKEIECAVLGNDEPRASLPGEIIPGDEFYSYQDKYIDGKSKNEIPAKLDEKVIKEIQGIAIKTFKALDLSGMARVDFFLTKDNKVILNEVNTIPGFTKISMYSKLWQASGLEYSDLLDELITLAIDRNKAKNELNTSYKPKTDWYK
ncbi:D-alanine--D-alanine ligase [bacterium]|jgi:D-alanine-D-alanine ligase|nr:D-alanine--D-alanine ligase [bacterium]MBT4495654.1 D-alanine--D-alanine ligase [bacterium]MBT4764130.1 D-alanine--D-alanine ligase [bacterium]MBT5401502.1 D-alanine--D-alanine ligase [bacterium]MBT5942539.1 D-alanine--D-alanine ligase [bacterium]